jgi:hypothetical protein
MQDSAPVRLADEKKVQSIAPEKVAAPSRPDYLDSQFTHRAQDAPVILLKLEEPSDEVVLTLSLGSELESPIARLRRQQFHRPFNRGVKAPALDRYARPHLFSFEIEKTAFKFDHQRPLARR